MTASGVQVTNHVVPRAGLIIGDAFAIILDGSKVIGKTYQADVQVNVE
ncbi:MAG: hypothetical protein HYV35_02915 [Lentisphaerae bacterium]|nr:hypothetical protein [Lentisphaerota bacterium]